MNLKDWINKVETHMIAENMTAQPLQIKQGQSTGPQFSITDPTTKSTITTSDPNVVSAAKQGKLTVGKQLEEEEVEEGIADSLKKLGQRAFDKLGGGNEDDLIRDLQKKAGLPQTGKKPESKENLDEVAPPGMEDLVMKLKDQYPGHPEKAYATAWSIKNKKDGKTESVEESVASDDKAEKAGKKVTKDIEYDEKKDKLDESVQLNESTLEEVLGRFPHEHKTCQEGWGMDESLYEALCDHYFKEGRIPHKVWHGSSENLRKHVEECYAQDTSMVVDETAELAVADTKDSMPDTLNDSADVIMTDVQDDGAEELEEMTELEKMLRHSTQMEDTMFESKKVNEKWAGDTKLDPKKKGMFKGRDIASLKSELEKLKASGPHKKDSPEYTKMKELNFAIRAKKNWKGTVEEGTVTKTATGLIHKAAPGGYGRKHETDEEGDEITKAVAAVKKGRGRPKKGGDSDTGEVKTYDFSAFMKPVKLTGKDSKGKALPTTTHKKMKEDVQMESWDRQLQSLLTEGLTVTTSVGQEGGNDSVSITASDDDAHNLLHILQNAGMGSGVPAQAVKAAVAPAMLQQQETQPTTDGEVAMFSVNPECEAPTEPEEIETTRNADIMDKLADQQDDGDSALAMLKKAISHNSAYATEPGQPQGPVEIELEEDEVEEGNKFSGELEKAKQAGEEEFEVDGKKYPVKEEADEEIEQEMDDDAEDEQAVSEEHEMCSECGGLMEDDHKCQAEELNEWANSPTGESEDEQFEADINFMTNAITAGLNGRKSTGQSTTPVLASQGSRQVSENIGYNINVGDMMKKLAGIK